MGVLVYAGKLTEEGKAAYLFGLTRRDSYGMPQIIPDLDVNSFSDISEVESSATRYPLRALHVTERRRVRKLAKQVREKLEDKLNEHPAEVYFMNEEQKKFYFVGRRADELYASIEGDIHTKNRLVLQRIAQESRLPQVVPSFMPDYSELDRKLTPEEILDDMENRSIHMNVAREPGRMRPSVFMPTSRDIDAETLYRNHFDEWADPNSPRSK